MRSMRVRFRSTELPWCPQSALLLHDHRLTAALFERRDRSSAFLGALGSSLAHARPLSWSCHTCPLQVCHARSQPRSALPYDPPRALGASRGCTHAVRTRTTPERRCLLETEGTKWGGPIGSEEIVGPCWRRNGQQALPMTGHEVPLLAGATEASCSASEEVLSQGVRAFATCRRANLCLLQRFLRPLRRSTAYLEAAGDNTIIAPCGAAKPQQSVSLSKRFLLSPESTRSWLARRYSMEQRTESGSEAVVCATSIAALACNHL